MSEKKEVSTRNTTFVKVKVPLPDRKENQPDHHGPVKIPVQERPFSWGALNWLGYQDRTILARCKEGEFELIPQAGYDPIKTQDAQGQGKSNDNNNFSRIIQKLQEKNLILSEKIPYLDKRKRKHTYVGYKLNPNNFAEVYLAFEQIGQLFLLGKSRYYQFSPQRKQIMTEFYTAVHTELHFSDHWLGEELAIYLPKLFTMYLMEPKQFKKKVKLLLKDISETLNEDKIISAPHYFLYGLALQELITVRIQHPEQTQHIEHLKNFMKREQFHIYLGVQNQVIFNKLSGHDPESSLYETTNNIIAKMNKKQLEEKKSARKR